MGIYDRDYYRDESSSQSTQAVRAVKQMSITNKLVLANVAVYMMCWLIGYDSPDRTLAIYDALAIDATFFTHPWQVWRLITAGFMHAPFWLPDGGDVMHIAFNMFGLWMFGRFIEQRYGSREFLRFYILAIVVSGLTFVVANVNAPDASAIGASGGVVAVVILYCCVYPRTKLLLMMIIPVDAWIVGLMYVGYDVYLGLQQAAGTMTGIAWQAHLGGAAFAAAYFKMGWRLEKITSWKQVFKRQPKLKVHSPDTSPSAPVVKDEISAEDQLIARGEKILQQVHEQGESSLTSRQRKTLERYSQIMQHRRE